MLHSGDLKVTETWFLLFRTVQICKVSGELSQDQPLCKYVFVLRVKVTAGAKHRACQQESLGRVRVTDKSRLQVAPCVCPLPSLDSSSQGATHPR